MTEESTQPDAFTVLRNAGVNPDELAQGHTDALGAITPVLGAAQTVISNLRTPGTTGRVDALRAALDALVARDPVSAVVVAAALWLDRYGSAGALIRLTDLQDAVDGLRRTDLGT